MQSVSPKLVLLVDDDPTVRRLMQKVLAHPTLELAEAASAEEALQFMEERWPAVLVVDCHMGGMTGPDLVRRVQDDMREMAPPAVLVTGSLGSIALADQALFARVLEKPFSGETLRPIVLRLAGWRSRQRSATIARPDAAQAPSKERGGSDR